MPCIVFLVLTLVAGVCARCGGASAEERAYAAAQKAYQLNSWEFARQKFAEFIQRFPESPLSPEAILFQAKSGYHLNRFAQALSLLSTNRARAGMWQDEYLYWIAQSQVGLTNYQGAAEVFSELGREFPDSPLRLEAALSEAAAVSRLGDWARVSSLLENPGGAFQQAANADPTNTFVIRGYLLLGEARLMRNDYSGVRAALDFLAGQPAGRALAWRREYLRCRMLLAEGEPQAALDNTTNLLALARAAAAIQPGGFQASTQPVPLYITQPAPGGLLAETWSFRGSILQGLNRFNEAIAAYRFNLTNAPVDQQRRALLKIAHLYAMDDKYPQAMKTLDEFLEQHPDSRAADMALLTIAELQMRQFALSARNPPVPAVTGSQTNLIDQAMARLDELLATYPSSPLAGKAILNKGWCYWLTLRYAESLEQFRTAAERLPFSSDQAVARFKWADAQFMQRDFAGAATNYHHVATQYDQLTDLDPRVLELALYQTVRAALTDNDRSVASRALQRILEQFPESFAGPHALLLLGQEFIRQNDPAGARELFTQFDKLYPENPLQAEVQLAVARTYERERNWDEAARQYNDWIGQFTNHAELPRAEFYRAWDYFMANRVTNAFDLFTNFIARFPSHELARQAQWWIADHYFRQGQFKDAAINYRWVYLNTNWAPSELSYQAQMMAGRAAMMANFGESEAFGYFTNLAGNPNCPLNLRIQATYLAGDALTTGAASDASGTNRFYREAIAWFSTIPESYPTNLFAPLALGRMADCYLQMADYEKASNTYHRVLSSSEANIATRSQARIGFGLAAEGAARVSTGDPEADAQRSLRLLNAALTNYLSVFLYEDNVREGENPDPFWIKKAGLEAGRVAEILQQWDQVILIYQKLEEWVPELRPLLEKKIANAQRRVDREKRSGEPFDSAAGGG